MTGGYDLFMYTEKESAYLYLLTLLTHRIYYGAVCSEIAAVGAG